MAYEIINTMNATNTNQLVDLFTNMSVATGNVFGLILLVTIFIGYLLLFGRQQRYEDLLASSFVTMIISVLLFLADIVTAMVVLGMFSITLLIFLGNFWLTR